MMPNSSGFRALTRCLDERQSKSLSIITGSVIIEAEIDTAPDQDDLR